MNYKIAFIIAGLTVSLIGCSSGNTEETVEVGKQTTSEPQKEVISESKVDVKTPMRESVKETPSLNTTITKEEFNAKFQLDPDEKQYENGVFEFKDGTKVNADYLVYGRSDLFDFAMVTFYNGELVDVQFETSKTPDELEEGLGMTFENAQVEVFPIGVEVTFNPTFHDNNIAVFPNEWD